MASRIAVMSEGKFLQVGSPSEIYETPTSRFVADFIGNVNLMDGVVTVDEADHVVVRCANCEHYIGHGITGTPGMAVTVGLRPEKITLSRHEPPAGGRHPQYNCVKGVVKELSYFGDSTMYRVHLEGAEVLKVAMENYDRHDAQRMFTWGETVWAYWPESAPVVLTQ